MAMKRSAKFYRKNEQKVMESLGLKPTPNSGSGWVVKEDGQNDEIICQLKSTDATSIRISKYDLNTLENNAAVTNKIPVFAIQFLTTGEVWLLTKPETLSDAAKYIDTGERADNPNEFIGIDTTDPNIKSKTIKVKTKVKSNESAREQFRQEQQDRYKKEKSAT